MSTQVIMLLSVAVVCITALAAASRLLPAQTLTAFMDNRFRQLHADLVQANMDILDARPALSRAQRLGLADVETSSRSLEYREIFEDAEQLTLLMNDAASWLDDNFDWVTERTLHRGMRLRVILVHPQSTYLPVLAHKVQLAPEDQRTRILETVDRLRAALGDSVEIWGHMLPSSYAVVMSGEKAVYVPYFTSRARGTVPALIFTSKQADGFFAQLEQDLQALRVDCRPVGRNLRVIADETDQVSPQTVEHGFAWTLSG